MVSPSAKLRPGNADNGVRKQAGFSVLDAIPSMNTQEQPLQSDAAAHNRAARIVVDRREQER